MTKSINTGQFSNEILGKSNILPGTPIPGSYWVRPGYLLAGEYPGDLYKEELTRKKIDSFLTIGIDRFINLTGMHELAEYKSKLLEQAEYFNLEISAYHFPIGDFGVPEPSLMWKILETIDHELQNGHKVYYHCYAGIGRTGTVTGCYLVKHGLTGYEALETLSQWWKQVPKSILSPNSPETNTQKKYILDWEKYIRPFKG